MQRAGLPQNFFPDVRAQASRGVKIYLASEKEGQLLLKSDEAQTRGAPGEELHQEVQVAFLVGLSPRKGAEEKEPPNPYRRQTSARAWEGMDTPKLIARFILVLGSPKCPRVRPPSDGPGSGPLL
jgi:hypothetical protein